MVGFLSGIYGAAELIIHSKASGWAWIAGGLGVMLLISLNVAHGAIRARNAAVSGESNQMSVIIQGGEHSHYYGEPPERQDGAE